MTNTATQPTSGHSEAGAMRPADVKRSAVLLTLACAAAAVMCAVLWGSGRSQARDLEARRTRATSLAADAAAIRRLRQCPQQASEVSMPQADLLARVTRSMQAARLDSATLVSAIPQSPRHLPGSDHAEVVHRLMFESVALEPLTRFCHALTTENPELGIGSIQLRAGRTCDTWNVDVGVTYWIIVATAGHQASASNG